MGVLILDSGPNLGLEVDLLEGLPCREKKPAFGPSMVYKNL